MTPYQFSQFFDYSAKDIPIEDFDEFFMLATGKCEFWDMLAGAIYHCNFPACQFLLKKHDYKLYIEDKEFLELIDQSLYQIEGEEHEDAAKVTTLINDVGLHLPYDDWRDWSEGTEVKGLKWRD